MKYIESLKDNKTSGEGSIVAETWKRASEEMIGKLQNVLAKIYEIKEILDEWKCAIINPSHKKYVAGDTTDVNKNRIISLLPATYEILSKAHLDRLEARVDHNIGKY